MILFVKGENLSKLSKEVMKKSVVMSLWHDCGGIFLFLTLPELDWKILIGWIYYLQFAFCSNFHIWSPHETPKTCRMNNFWMFIKSKKEIGPYWPVSPDLCQLFFKFFFIVYCWHLIVITGANMAVDSSFVCFVSLLSHGSWCALKWGLSRLALHYISIKYVGLASQKKM